MSNLSWLAEGVVCVLCKYPIVVTQPNIDTNPTDDYQWYCPNPSCQNHTAKEHTPDNEMASFCEVENE